MLLIYWSDRAILSCCLLRGKGLCARSLSFRSYGIFYDVCCSNVLELCTIPRVAYLVTCSVSYKQLDSARDRALVLLCVAYDLCHNFRSHDKSCICVASLSKKPMHSDAERVLLSVCCMFFVLFRCAKLSLSMWPKHFQLSCDAAVFVVPSKNEQVSFREFTLWARRCSVHVERLPLSICVHVEETHPLSCARVCTR